jgi:hypothetical protein
MSAAMLLAMLVLLPFRPAAAADACAATPPLQVTDVASRSAALHDWVTVHVAGLSAVAAGCDPAKFTLRLEGQALPGLLVKVGRDSGGDTLGFYLDRKSGDADRWLPTLGSPDGTIRTVTVAVGPEGQPDLPHAGDKMPTVGFEVLGLPTQGLAAALGLAALALMIWAARETDILRDAQDVAAGQRRPYSLGRCQMAFWSMLLTTAFLVLWLITGTYNGILTSQSLILLGISGATALGAVSIDGSKVATAAADADKAAKAAVAAGLQAPPAPVAPHHTRFLDDILTDKNGIALQRLQVLIWTLVLGAISIWSIYRNLSLPAFDETLLTMSGISSGLYVGFKFPEKQS